MRRRSRPRTRRAVLAVGLLGVLLLGGASTAGGRPTDAAQAVTRAEAAALARRAASDDTALADLRAVDEIDGVPADLDAALVDVGSGAARAARLEALAQQLDGAGPSTRPDPAASRRDRRDAREVLDGRAYRDRKLPKPFRGVLRWIGDRLAPVGRFLDRTFGPLVEALGGLGWLLLAGIAALAAWGATGLVARRSRSAVAVAGSGRALVDLDQDPAEVERAADSAEAAGDLGRAVRLRYEAGLIRLVRAGRLQLRTDTTASRAAAEVGGVTMAALTSTFEEIVYGRRPGTADDVAAARAGWLEVLGAGARR